MNYRDDRDALRERNAVLEGELAATQEELAHEKARAAGQRNARSKTRARALLRMISALALIGGVPAAIAWGVWALATRLPRTCGLNESITVSGKRFDGPGPVVDVTGYNCTVTIRDSYLKSDVVVRGNQNLKLIVVNSTLEGSEAALDLQGTNADVDLSQRSVLSGKVGIRGKLNTHLKMQDSKILAESAILGRDNFELDATDAEIRGRIVAIDAKNPNLQMRRTTIASEGIAIQTELNANIEAEGSTIQGADSAIVCPLNLDLKLTAGSRVQAQDVAVDAPQNAKVAVHDSTIESDGTALSLRSGNGVVHGGKGARFVAKKTAIHGGGSLTLQLDRALVQGEGTAVLGDNLSVVAKKSQILGATAFFLNHAPRLELDDDTIVRGTRTYPER